MCVRLLTFTWTSRCCHLSVQSHLDCGATFIAAWAGGAVDVFALGARDYFFKSPLFVSEVTFTLHVLFLRRVVTFTFWSLFSLFHPPPFSPP